MSRHLLLAALLVAGLAAAARAQDTGGVPDNPSSFEDDTLIIKAPRLKIKKTGLDPQINATLLRLLRQKQDARPDTLASLDPSLLNLGKLTTVTGYNLMTRYTQLGFLLTEGLAGVKDFDIDQELQNTAKNATNVQIQAAAMVSLSYTKDLQYLPLFQGEQQNTNITVRFGALESLLRLQNDAALFQIMNAAQTDPSIIVQLYAAAGLWKMGNVFGREILLRHYQDSDWFVRAMATHYIGELGGADEYRRLFSQLNFEDNPQVKAELCSALIRLERFKED